METGDGDTVNVEDPTLVGYDPTNALHNYTIFEQIILCKHTNIILKELRERHPEIVCRWETILKGDRALETVNLMYEKQVFAIPTLIHELAKTYNETYSTTKPYVYEVKTVLETERLLVRTPYKAVKPDPHLTGPKPFFFAWSYLELNGWNDPLLKRAQKEYNEAFAGLLTVRDEAKQSADNILLTISREVTDYYRDRGQTGIHQAPSRMNVIDYLRTNYPNLQGPNIAEISQKVSQSLYKEVSN